ncbi:NAD(P)H-dependent FMN reductase [Pseudohyphozyma bogoriensis]|nr:NAD(P)H-dependent FMN reductase [Pseudohyphozyma bogoriensis]
MTVPLSSPISSPVVGLLLGSTRPTGNGVGLGSWLTSVVTPFLPPHTTIKTLDATKLGLIHSPLAPFQISDRPAGYPDAATREWSVQVESCDGFIILTPQHNHSFPAYIKNAIDHLSAEWQRKPVLLVGYSARGDGRGVRQLREVLESEGTLEMRVGRWLGELRLPKEYWDGRKGMRRLGTEGLVDGEEAEWLKERREDVEESVREWVENLKVKLPKISQ